MGNMIPIASFRTTITNAISSSATTIPIDKVTDDAGTSMDTLVLGFLIDRGLTTEEFVVGTVDAGNSQLTSVTRGVSPRDGQTSVAGLKFAHRKKATIEITDHPYLTLAMRQLDGTDSLTGVPKNPSSRSISDSRHLTDKEYVDLIAAAAGGISSLLVSDAGGININVAAGYLVSSDGVISYAGVSGQALTNNATNYVELKPDGTLTINTTSFTPGYLPLAIVTTLSNDITVLTDTRGWFTSPAPERVISTDFTYGATLAAGDPVYVDSSASNKLKKALATGASTADPFIGIALDAGVDTDTRKRVQLTGLVSGLTGLTVGFQYLTDAGGLSTTAGTYRKLVGYAPSSTSLILFPGFRAEDISGGNSSLTTAILNEMAIFFAGTDETAPEAETLTNGSDADSLHFHNMVGLIRRANAGLTRGYFAQIPFANLTSSATGGSLTQTTGVETAINSGGASDNFYIARSSTPTIFDWADPIRILAQVAFSDTTSQDACVGLFADTTVPVDATLTSRHAAFLLQDGTLYASCADGTTQTRTSVAASITLTQWNTLEINFTTSSVQFLINGTVAATITTNIPTSGTSNYGLFMGIATRSANQRRIYTTPTPFIVSGVPTP